MTTNEFQQFIWHKADELYRPMPWREAPTLYHVLVSELMLQQTQVSRVLAKFEEFMHQFPTIEDLAAASLADVLVTWQGLGYNRRAKYLHEAARRIVQAGTPTTQAELMALPGVGMNTAGAIMNYVYEVAMPFIETNIRTVYFHHWFASQTAVSDRAVLDVVARTLDREYPRQWFWALMDYGAELKRQGYGRLQTSKHYIKQSPLEGSMRQMRGEIIRRLTSGQTMATITSQLRHDPRFAAAQQGLEKDGLLP